jgi:hypothetical protein
MKMEIRSLQKGEDFNKSASPLCSLLPGCSATSKGHTRLNLNKKNKEIRKKEKREESDFFSFVPRSPR